MNNEQEIYHYKENFDGLVFQKNFIAKHYIDCTFNKCNFVKCQPREILELLQSTNTLIKCWYDPTLILSKIFDSLNNDINLVDCINKALIRSDSKQLKDGKQLILIDL